MLLAVLSAFLAAKRNVFCITLVFVSIPSKIACVDEELDPLQAAGFDFSPPHKSC
jgi:hypothetical protein